MTALNQNQPASSGTPQAVPSTEVQNNVTVGDLHMRQRRYREAVMAYEQAVRGQMSTLRDPKTHHDLQALLKAVEIANKLTEAHQGARDASGARRSEAMSLKFAEAALKLSESLKGKAPAAAPAIPLPAQLIVSAPKKLMDQMSGGKMTFDEFRKGATVEYLKFGSASAKDDPKKP
jgi:hypothetical protein